MVKQYVGARYVPKFASPVEWAANTSYEALTIVTFNNASYTSKIPVPPTVGNPANNPQYWALTGNYNAQVEQYRQETANYNAQVEQYRQETANYNAQVEQYRQETANYNLHSAYTVDAFNDLSNAPANAKVYRILGYYEKGDGGEGYWVNTTDATNDYTIKKINDKTLKLLHSNELYPEQIGAHANDNEDDAPYIQFLLDNNIKCKLHNKTYLCSTLTARDCSIIEGNNVANEYLKGAIIHLTGALNTDGPEVSGAAIGAKFSGLLFKGNLNNSFTSGTFKWCTFDNVSWQYFNKVFDNCQFLGVNLHNFFINNSNAGCINGSDNFVSNGFVGYRQNDTENKQCFIMGMALTIFSNVYFTAADPTSSKGYDNVLYITGYSNGSVVENCVFDYCGKEALIVGTAAPTAAKNLTITNNRFRKWNLLNNNYPVIDVKYFNYVNITNNIVISDNDTSIKLHDFVNYANITNNVGCNIKITSGDNVYSTRIDQSGQSANTVGYQSGNTLVIGYKNFIHPFTLKSTAFTNGIGHIYGNIDYPYFSSGTAFINATSAILTNVVSFSVNTTEHRFDIAVTAHTPGGGNYTGDALTFNGVIFGYK